MLRTLKKQICGGSGLGSSAVHIKSENTDFWQECWKLPSFCLKKLGLQHFCQDIIDMVQFYFGIWVLFKNLVPPDVYPLYEGSPLVGECLEIGNFLSEDVNHRKCTGWNLSNISQHLQRICKIATALLQQAKFFPSASLSACILLISDNIAFQLLIQEILGALQDF